MTWDLNSKVSKITNQTMLEGRLVLESGSSGILRSKNFPKAKRKYNKICLGLHTKHPYTFYIKFKVFAFGKFAEVVVQG